MTVKMEGFDTDYKRVFTDGHRGHNSAQSISHKDEINVGGFMPAVVASDAGNLQEDTEANDKSVKKEADDLEHTKIDIQEYNLRALSYEWPKNFKIEEINDAIIITDLTSKVGCSSDPRKQSTVKMDDSGSDCKRVCSDGHRENHVAQIISRKDDSNVGGFMSAVVVSDEGNLEEDNNDMISAEVAVKDEPEHDERFPCKLCAFKAKSEAILVRHFKLKHDEDSEWFYRQICEYEPKYKHKLTVDTERNREAGGELFECYLCGYKSDSKDILVYHIRVEHLQEKDEWLLCHRCGYKTKSLVSLKAHSRWKHELTEWFNCANCDYKTRSKHHLTRHLCYRHSADWLCCKQCEFRTKNKQHMENHNLQHNVKVVWHCCQHCKYKTQNKYKLELHLGQSHRGNEMLKCQYFECHFKTKTKEHLQQHIKTNHKVNVQWYSCSMCSFKSTGRYYLMCHFVHTHLKGSEWQQCLFCEHRARLGTDLLQHFQVEHAEKAA